MGPVGSPEADPEIQDLMDLCLNNLDCFSVVLFMADHPGGPLRIRAVQSLSKNLNFQASIKAGQGLIGWVYRHKKPVNVDQVEFDTETLLFYHLDENIKSFMALPLADCPGVLAADSKQRYLFTDKSVKLFFQFGKTIERVWGRLSKSRRSRSGASGPAGGPVVPGDVEEEMYLFWRELEFLLARPDHDGGGLAPALELIRVQTGFSWAFLTVILPGDHRNYHLIAQSGPGAEGLTRKLPLTSGLVGWVHTKLKPLAMEKLKADGRHSYIFHRDEPLKGVGSFYGWPLLYHQQARGALILAGSKGQSLPPGETHLLECLALRLSAQLQQDRLVTKMVELVRVDPQTGLPHRGYFLERLGRLMDLASLNGGGAALYVLAVSGLGGLARDCGQEAAMGLLQSIAKALLSGAKGKNNWESGHISYGLFTLATLAEEAEEAQKLIADFKKRLEDWPHPKRSGRAELGLAVALARYPEDAAKPEELLELTLTALAEMDEGDGGEDGE